MVKFLLGATILYMDTYSIKVSSFISLMIFQPCKAVKLTEILTNQQVWLTRLLENETGDSSVTCYFQCSPATSVRCHLRSRAIFARSASWYSITENCVST